MKIQDIQALSELANLLYDFLPANPHPYANQAISFSGCAAKAGGSKYWVGGSKRASEKEKLNCSKR